MPIDFKSCREEIAGALQKFCNRWCKREHVESNALNIPDKTRKAPLRNVELSGRSQVKGQFRVY